MNRSKPLNRVTEFYLDPQTGVAFTVQQGQIIRIIDVEGEQVSDLVCFSKRDIDEHLSSGRTTDYNEKIYLSTGDVLYSNLSNPMFTILTDQVGNHICLFAPCSQEMFQITYGVTEPHPNCLDNLSKNLQPFSVKPAQIPTPFNIFMNITISEQGTITVEPSLSKAGNYVELRAEIDLIVGITACSTRKCNNYRCTPIAIEVYQ